MESRQCQGLILEEADYHERFHVLHDNLYVEAGSAVIYHDASLNDFLNEATYKILFTLQLSMNFADIHFLFIKFFCEGTMKDQSFSICPWPLHLEQIE